MGKRGSNNSEMFGARTASDTVPRKRMSSIGAHVAPTFHVLLYPTLSSPPGERRVEGQLTCKVTIEEDRQSNLGKDISHIVLTLRVVLLSVVKRYNEYSHGEID